MCAQYLMLPAHVFCCVARKILPTATQDWQLEKNGIITIIFNFAVSGAFKGQHNKGCTSVQNVSTKSNGSNYSEFNAAESYSWRAVYHGQGACSVL